MYTIRCTIVVGRRNRKIVFQLKRKTPYLPDNQAIPFAPGARFELGMLIRDPIMVITFYHYRARGSVHFTIGFFFLWGRSYIDMKNKKKTHVKRPKSDQIKHCEIRIRPLVF